MPFGQDAEEERWFKGWYEAVIYPAIESLGLEPILAATQDQPSAINDEIRSHLVFDDVVVVDLGGRRVNDPPNPNVMYELGIRACLRTSSRPLGVGRATSSIRRYKPAGNPV